MTGVLCTVYGAQVYFSVVVQMERMGTLGWALAFRPIVGSGWVVLVLTTYVPLTIFQSHRDMDWKQKGY